MFWLFYNRNSQGVELSRWIFDADRTKGYRIVFKGVGSRLTGELYELTNLTTPVKVLNGSTPRSIRLRRTVAPRRHR